MHRSHTLEFQTLERLYANMLLSGYKGVSREEFLESLNLAGGSVSITASQGVVRMTIKSPAKTFKKVMSIVANLYAQPSFTQSELKRVKTLTKNKLELEKENSRGSAHINFQNQFYGANDRHSSKTLSTLINNIDSVTVPQLRNHHKQFLSSNFIVTAALSGSEEKILSNFLDTVQTMSKGNSAEVTQAVLTKIPKAKLVTQNIPSEHNVEFSLGAPLPISNKSGEYIKILFALRVLGGGSFTSRLMSTVREAEGLTYGIYARMQGFFGRETGYWRIITFFSPDKTSEGLQSVLRQLKKLHSQGISAKELKGFKNMIQTETILRGDSILSQLAHVHSFHEQGMHAKEVEDFNEKIQALTGSEVNRAIKQYLDPSRMIISAAGPVKKVQKELERFAKSV